MAKVVQSAICVLTIVAMTGCATIVQGGTEDVSISSEPSSADVTIVDAHDNEVFSGTTPSTATLDKGDGYFVGAEYTVTISADGYGTQTVDIGSSISGWYVAGNFFVGYLLGWLVIDPISGAMWRLSPSEIDQSLDSESAAADGSLHVVLVEDVPLELRPRMEAVDVAQAE